MPNKGLQLVRGQNCAHPSFHHRRSGIVRSRGLAVLALDLSREPFCGEAPMLRVLICAVILFACATSSKTVTRDVHDCVYLGLIDGGSRSEIVSETQTMGPSHVIWLHPPEVVRGYLFELNRSLYSCPSPRPAAASFKQG
jgi:hypothetical protein